jgi:glycosyltransferase involved in cell wall biosynthesis
VPRRINVLYIMDHFHGTGGTERHLAYLVGHLPQAQFQCRIAVLDLAANRWVDRIAAGGIPVTHVPVAREYAPGALLRALDLSRIIRFNSIDIVQTFHQKSDTYAAIVAKVSGVKHIISSKRDSGDLKKPVHYFLNRRLRGLFERVIVVSDSVGDVVVARERVPRSRIVRIYNGVDADAFAPPTPHERMHARERLGFAGEEFVVGMVARFRPEKSYEVFITGALQAAAEIPSLRIVAVGGGPLLGEFRNHYARELDQRRVQIVDDVNDVVAYLHAMDVGCLLPARNEGFSNSVLEMMAVGLPLIVTDVGGNSEAVIDQDNGLVIPPRDTDAFRRALLALYSDPTNRLKMGRRSRQLVEEKFTVRRMCKEHEALYLSLMKGGC